MAAPTPRVRGQVLLRDGSQCVSCTTRTSPLEMQHRQRVGMGGDKRRPAPHELATACSTCNRRFERDLQTRALVFGWKVRAWVKDPGLVPLFNAARGQWCLLTSTGGFIPITADAAYARMREVYGPEWDQWAEEIGLLSAATTRGTHE
ncbi:hypothetical protein CSIV_05110 [Microbacterium sp. CSI-V]|uniref:hypothetical protein n=1 Tax=Microbacterium sp. CSI-V TaxID=1933777 RepID=UPI00097C9BAE|nr:hypothetical protein [Microbacterium sp. CSI-V]ONI65659.1 hypothetical protein CSIV_05110 [Microbacterium sp. CSI-V]